MKKIHLIAFISVFALNMGFSQNTTAPFDKQLWRNLHLNWDVDNADDYRWSNFGFGTGIARNFESLPKAYWYVGGDLNWSKCTLYRNGAYNATGNDVYFKTTSISFPAYVGYHLYESSLRAFGVKVYTGPILETIFSSKLDGYGYQDYNPVQLGLVIGTSVKLMYLFGFNVSYRYYPTALLSNGNLVRSSVNFSLGF